LLLFANQVYYHEETERWRVSSLQGNDAKKVFNSIDALSDCFFCSNELAFILSKKTKAARIEEYLRLRYPSFFSHGTVSSSQSSATTPTEVISPTSTSQTTAVSAQLPNTTTDSTPLHCAHPSTSPCPLAPLVEAKRKKLMDLKVPQLVSYFIEKISNSMSLSQVQSTKDNIKTLWSTIRAMLNYLDKGIPPVSRTISITLYYYHHFY
jgi:hypothetical protein